MHRAGELVAEGWSGSPDQVQQHKQILEKEKQGGREGGDALMTHILGESP